MAHLHYQDTSFVGSVSQTTDIVLAGESSAAPLAEDYTIEVQANLGGLLSYSGAYSSANISTGQTATYPTVNIDSTLLSTAAATVDTIFRDKEAAGNLMPSPNEATPHLQGMFKTLDWSYPKAGTLAVFPAGSTPVEAVIAVSFGALTATTFTQAISTGVWSSSDGTSHAVNLFEQCLAAGKIDASTLSDVGATPSGAASFSPGDSVSLYVSYTLSKTRSYTADSSVSAVAGTNPTATITVGGVTVGSSAVTEDAEDIVKVVRWKFVHSGGV